MNTLSNKINEQLILEIQNSLGSDVNEILVGLYLAGGDWNLYHNSQEVQAQLKKRKAQISKEEYKDQAGRAQEMAHEAMAWARENKYTSKIVQVYWTARTGVLQKAVGRPVDSRKNPTDILVKFANGKFLGLSAKSTAGSGDISFKNPGLGHVDTVFSLNLAEIQKQMEAKAAKKYKLPDSSIQRKQFIRNNPSIQVKTQEAGMVILSTLRDLFLKKLETLKQEELRKYILEYWLDVDENLYPYYIKVTGHGRGGNYTADVHDPLNNPKLKKILLGKLTFDLSAKTGIYLVADGKRILKMRFKYESEKIASSLKMVGDPAGSKADDHD